jgi:hypothetical protein
MPLSAGKSRRARRCAAGYGDPATAFVDIFHNLPPIPPH